MTPNETRHLPSDPRRRESRRRRTSARRRRESGATITLDFAPMIDVTFLLLIFFLVTTTFERAEGILDSQMPKDSGAPAVALPLSPIVVRLSQLGETHDDFAISLDRFPQRPTTFSELTETIRAIHELPGFDRETPTVIVADNDVRWDHVVGCWNAALRAGCRSIAFGQR